MSHLQLSYLPFVSHSSTFWRTVQSKSRWPAETLLGRALERCRRAGHRAASASMQDRAPLSRATSHRFPFAPVAWEREPSRGSACYAVLVRFGMSSGPTPVPAHTSWGWPPYCRVKCQVLASRRKEGVARYKDCSRPSLDTLLSAACALSRTPSSGLFRRSPALSRSSPRSPEPARAASVRTAPSIAPEQKLQRQEPPATVASRRRALPYPVREHKSVVGEPLSTPPPFPSRAEPSPRRIELPPPAMAPGTQLQSIFSSRGHVCEIRGSVRKSVSSRFAENFENSYKIVEKS
jgi:hypothetical protein